jgi:hypothetical protein
MGEMKTASSGSQETEEEGGYCGYYYERVATVEKTSVPRQEVARVLKARTPFDARLDQVSQYAYPTTE